MPVSQLSPNSRFALTLGGAVAVAGSLLYAGWFANGLLRDIKDELGALRRDMRAVSSDRWTGRDMRDYSAELKDLNTAVSRTDGKVGLLVPDVRHIIRANQSEN
jgi:hypothetical protein